MITLTVKVSLNKDLSITTDIDQEYEVHEGYEALQESTAKVLECVFGSLYEKAVREKQDALLKKIEDGDLSDIYREADEFLSSKVENS